MRSAELKNQIAKNGLAPTIFGYADANHYLVGAEDKQGNFFSLSDDKNQAVVFGSMYEAECCLKAMGFSHAHLHFQTAYDEMIGNDAANVTRISISLGAH